MKYPTFLLCLSLLFTACELSESPAKSAENSSNRIVRAENAIPPNAEQASKRSAETVVIGDITSNTKSLDSHGNTAATPFPSLLVNRKLIWDAHLEFRVKDLDQSTRAIRSLCKKHEGYISDMERVREPYELSVNIKARVSSAHFHDLVAAIKGESEQLDVAKITSQDVTEEYLDIENRLTTKRQARKRYIEILRSKTGTIEEVIEAEEAIRRITEEIEAKEGRLRYLSDQIDFSTIEIRMYTPQKSPQTKVAEEESYGDEVSTSFSSGWNFIKELGLVLIAIWPLIITLLAIIIWKRKWIRSKLKTGAKT